MLSLTSLNDFSGTKESIKGAKVWFMQRAAYGPALVEVLKDRVLSMDDVERQLHIIYLANDILFNRFEASDSTFVLIFYSAFGNYTNGRAVGYLFRHL